MRKVERGQEETARCRKTDKKNKKTTYSVCTSRGCENALAGGRHEVPVTGPDVHADPPRGGQERAVPGAHHPARPPAAQLGHHHGHLRVRRQTDADHILRTRPVSSQSASFTS